MRTIKGKKLWVKVVTLVLVQSFIGWNAATAAVSERSMWHKRGKVSMIGTSASSNILEQENLQKTLFSEYFVPETAGTINEFWVPKGMDKNALSSSKLLIHVRDAHCNYEAQTNISKIIDNFVKTNGVDFVALEGAEGTVDYSLLNAYPDYTVRSEVSDYFMKEGRLSGAEYANINADKPYTLFGAEKISVYDSNLNNFRDTLTYKESGLEFVGQIKEALASLRSNMYTPELKEIEEMSDLYNNREISFVDYCQYLYNLPAAEDIRSGYKNFALLMEAIRVQDLINFAQIDAEKTELVNELARKVTREDLNTLTRATIDFRRGKLSTAKYYQTLEILAKESGLNLASFRNLRPYMVYLNVYEQIDSAELFKEKETLESEIKRSLFKNLDQARLDKLSKNAEILEKIFSVRLTNADLKYFQDFRSDFTAWEFKNFIQEQAPKYNLTFNIDYTNDPLEKYLPKLEAFYNEAKTRDILLAENAMAQMDLEGKNVGVLVSGGFHTAGITEHLRSQNIAYMVVTPRILREDVNNPYLNLISGGKIPFEKLIEKDFQFSLALKINDKETATTVASALNTAPNKKLAAVDERWSEAIQADKSRLEIDVAQLGQYQVGETLVGLVRIGEDTYVVVPDKTPQSVFDAINLDKDAQSTQVASWELKKAPTGLKGVLDAKKNAQVATKNNDVVASSLDDLVKGAKGTVKEFLGKVVDAIKVLPVKVDDADVAAVEVQAGKISAYPYEGIPLVDKDLTTEAALADQQVVALVDDAGALKVVAAKRNLIRAAARAQLGDPTAVKLTAAKLAHDIYEKGQRDNGVDAEAAHDDALQKVDSEVLSDSDFADLAEVDSFLDSGDVATAEQVAANKALAEAIDAYEADPSDANALKVFLAELALRGSKPGTTAEAILKGQDPKLLATVFAKQGAQGFTGISATRSVFVQNEAEPAIGELAEANVELNQQVFDILNERGVTSLVIAPSVSEDVKAQIFEQIFTGTEAITLADAAERLNVSSDISVFALPEEGGVRIIVEDATTFASEQSEVEALQAGATAAQAVTAGTDELFLIKVDVDDIEAGSESENALLVGAANLSRNKSIKVQLFSTNNDTARISAVRERLNATEAGLNDTIVTESQVADLSDKLSVDRTAVITSQEINLSDFAASRVLNVQGENIRYDAALPLAAISLIGISGVDLAVIQTLVGQLGLPTDEASIQALLSQPAIGLPAVAPFNINILSIKLAIAA